MSLSPSLCLHFLFQLPFVFITPFLYHRYVYTHSLYIYIYIRTCVCIIYLYVYIYIYIQYTYVHLHTTVSLLVMLFTYAFHLFIPSYQCSITLVLAKKGLPVSFNSCNAIGKRVTSRLMIIALNSLSRSGSLPQAMIALVSMRFAWHMKSNEYIRIQFTSLVLFDLSITSM